MKFALPYNSNEESALHFGSTLFIDRWIRGFLAGSKNNDYYEFGSDEIVILDLDLTVKLINSGSNLK